MPNGMQGTRPYQISPFETLVGGGAKIGRSYIDAYQKAKREALAEQRAEERFKLEKTSLKLREDTFKAQQEEKKRQREELQMERDAAQAALEKQHEARIQFGQLMQQGKPIEAWQVLAAGGGRPAEIAVGKIAEIQRAQAGITAEKEERHRVGLQRGEMAEILQKQKGERPQMPTAEADKWDFAIKGVQTGLISEENAWDMTHPDQAADKTIARKMEAIKPLVNRFSKERLSDNTLNPLYNPEMADFLNAFAVGAAPAGISDVLGISKYAQARISEWNAKREAAKERDKMELRLAKLNAESQAYKDLEAAIARREKADNKREIGLKTQTLLKLSTEIRNMQGNPMLSGEPNIQQTINILQRELDIIDQELKDLRAATPEQIREQRERQKEEIKAQIKRQLPPQKRVEWILRDGTQAQKKVVNQLRGKTVGGTLITDAEIIEALKFKNLLR